MWRGRNSATNSPNAKPKVVKASSGRLILDLVSSDSEDHEKAPAPLAPALARIPSSANIKNSPVVAAKAREAIKTLSQILGKPETDPILNELLNKTNGNIDAAVNLFMDPPAPKENERGRANVIEVDLDDEDFGFAHKPIPKSPKTNAKRPREEDSPQSQSKRARLSPRPSNKNRLETLLEVSAPTLNQNNNSNNNTKNNIRNSNNKKNNILEKEEEDIENEMEIEDEEERLPLVFEHQTEGEAAMSRFAVEPEEEYLAPLREVEARPLMWWKNDKFRAWKPGDPYPASTARPTVYIPQNRTKFKYLSELTRELSPASLLATRVLDVLDDAPETLEELMPEHFEDRDLCEALQLALEEGFITFDAKYRSVTRRVQLDIYLYEPLNTKPWNQFTGHVDQAVALARLFRALFPETLTDENLALKIHNRMEFSPEEAVMELLPRLVSGPYVRAEETPKGILLKMRRYQRESLAWMIDVEQRGWDPLIFTTLKFADGRSFLWHPQSAILTLEPIERVYGGMLAEEMGLGKTLEMLSLVKARPRTDVDVETLNLKATLIMYLFSLVPPSLIAQWETEVKKSVSSGELKVLVYTTEERKRIETLRAKRSVQAREFIDYDVVLTTYSQTNSAPLRLVSWHRIILDESQSVKSYNSKQSARIRTFKATHRWAASGTPISTKIEDLYGQFAFLRAEPLASWVFFDRHISPPHPKLSDRSAKHANQSLLEDVLSRGLMRHLKNQILHGETVCPLPDLNTEIVFLPMSPEERGHYDVRWMRLEREVREMYARLGAQKMLAKFFYLNSQLATLRRFCALPFRPEVLGFGSVGAFDYAREHRSTAQHRERIDYLKVKLIERMRDPCSICLEVMERPAALKCEHLFCLECISDHFRKSRNNCPLCRAASFPRDLVELPAPPPLPQDAALAEEAKALEKKRLEDLKDKKKAPSSESTRTLFLNGSNTSMRHPTKLNRLIEDIRALRKSDPKAKCVVFSQFKDSLSAIAEAFTISNISFTSLDGTSTIQQRRTALKDFNEDPSIVVFLLSQRAGSVGITLTAASTVFIFDHIINPAQEDQAIGRCHRLGQLKKVRVVKYIMKDTVEELYHNARHGPALAPQVAPAPVPHPPPRNIIPNNNNNNEKNEKNNKNDEDAMDIDEAPNLNANPNPPNNGVVRNLNTRKVGISTLLGFFGYDVLTDAARLNAAEAERLRLQKEIEARERLQRRNRPDSDDSDD